MHLKNYSNSNKDYDSGWVFEYVEKVKIQVSMYSAYLWLTGSIAVLQLQSRALTKPGFNFGV